MQRNPVNRAVSIAIRIGVLATLVLAARFAVLVALADWEFRLGRPETVAVAERLVPGNAQYHYAHALLLDQTEPTSRSSEREFTIAVAENPRYSDALLAWSVNKELRGDKDGAEQLLLQAQLHDHLLRPAWALANFYYRQDDAERFWPQARAALEIIVKTGLSEGRFNPIAVFDLSWRMSSDSKTILTRAIPNDLDDAYLAYLMGTGRSPAAIELVDYMLPRVTKSDILFLAPYSTLLIEQNRMDTAIRTWKAYVRRGVVSSSGPDPAAGVFLNDGNLSGPPTGFGFGWRVVGPEPIRFSYDPSTPAFHFEFDGNGPEQCPLLAQVVPLTGGKAYRFKTRYRCSAEEAQNSFTWILNDHSTGAPIPGRFDPKTAIMEFTAPAKSDAADLTLLYTRQPGTTRFQGTFDLLQAELGLR